MEHLIFELQLTDSMNEEFEEALRKGEIIWKKDLTEAQHYDMAQRAMHDNNIIDTEDYYHIIPEPDQEPIEN